MDISAIQHELDSGGFELDRHDHVQEGNNYIDYEVIPYISDPVAWKQYTNDALYDCEVRLRKWLEEMQSNPAFRNKRINRTFKFSQVFRILYGREYEQKIDGKYSTPFSKLFRYYCSRTGRGFYDKETGKTQSKTSFTFSLARLKRPPYSLKLRLEWLREQGIIPTAQNMKLPKDDLNIGQARNPLTEANRQKRSEQAKARYNEYQRNLRVEHKEGRPIRSYNRRASAADDAVQNDR